MRGRVCSEFVAATRVIEERSFVAKDAPLDDGQKRFGGGTGRVGEADRLNPHPLREAIAQRVRHPESLLRGGAEIEERSLVAAAKAVRASVGMTT